MSSRPGSAFVVVAAAIALLLFPFWGLLSGTQPESLFNTLAADTYYYAAMARNFTAHGFFGIDGETVSNGYMPLWQMIVAGLDLLLAGPGTAPTVLLTAVFIASALLTAAGLALIVLFAMQHAGPGRTLLLLPILVPGAAFFALEHAYRKVPAVGLHSGFGAWSQANGMESGIGLLCFAAFLWAAARSLDPDRATGGSAALAGALAFLVMMGRLDDVFLGLAFGLILLPQAAVTSRPRLVFAMALVPLLGTALYVWMNLVTAGTPLPTSGASKTELFGFPTGWDIVRQIGRDQIFDGRLLPLFSALLMGALGLLSQRGKPLNNAQASLVRMLSLYLILKAGFLFSSVPILKQGYWYYTNMLATMNLLIFLAVARALPPAPPRSALVLGTTVTLGMVLLAGVNVQDQLGRYRDDDYTVAARDLCTDPARVEKWLPRDARIIDTGDGVYAFCLGRPAITVTGLADSRAFRTRALEIGLFAAALEKGHDIVVESPIRWASYDWRSLLTDSHRTVLVGEDPGFRVWRIEPK